MLLVICIIGFFVGCGFLGLSSGMNWTPGYIIGGIIAGLSVLILIIGSIIKGGLKGESKNPKKKEGDEKQVTVEINGEKYSGTVKKDKK